MERTIKQLSGHSGSTVLLKENSKYGVYVEKTGNVSRNFERMTALTDKSFRVPKIYEYSAEEEILKMEYISGLDTRTYLRYNPPNKLFEFISLVINDLAYSGRLLDVHILAQEPLKFLDTDNPFIFTKDELIATLPQTILETDYIGDLTLDNILWDDSSGFVIIDPVTVPYQSFIFDLAKLRQDTKCGWFLRNHPQDNNLLLAMRHLEEMILSQFPQVTDEMLILMLLRVFKHCEKNSSDYQFIIQKANSLWK
jgi:hypothetical protein